MVLLIVLIHSFVDCISVYLIISKFFSVLIMLSSFQLTRVMSLLNDLSVNSQISDLLH